MKLFKYSSTIFFATTVAAITLCTAPAEAAISVVRGQFAERVERGQPIGDGPSARATGTVVYFLVVNNSGPPADLTIEWSVNGHSVQRQTLNIGSAPRWRTWASRRVSRTGSVSIKVFDAAGTMIHEAQLAAQAP
jgi:hypothetical protein